LTRVTEVNFQGNACINAEAKNVDEFESLKTVLLLQCSPLSATIEATSLHGMTFHAYYTNVYWESNLYTCQVTKAYGVNATLTAIKGTHLSGKTNEDVQGLELIDVYSFDQIPINLDHFYPNLIAIEFSKGNLSSVTANDLKPFSNLKILSIWKNKIVTIEGDLFRFTPNIQWIYFNNNMITSVGSDLLSELSNLTYANFGYNPCISTVATGGAEIESLKTELLNKCPSLYTTTPAESTTPDECWTIICKIERSIERYETTLQTTQPNN